VFDPGIHQRVERSAGEGHSKALGLEAADEVIDYVLARLHQLGNAPLAGYQPKFIVDQVIAACKFEGIPPQYRPEFVDMALANLHPKDPRPAAPPPANVSLMRRAGP
jgi:hypothetical protein